MAVISVIIPLFNKEKYITRALESVFAQTYHDFEIIVVDDGSTDAGPELVQKYQDQRLRLIRQQNQGPGAARNRGIKESTAPYLAFLDADDEWLPDFLGRYLDALENNPDCAYVVGPWFEGDTRIDKSDIWRKLGVQEGPWQLPLGVTHTELHDNLNTFHWTCAMVIRRHVVEKYGGFYAKDKCRYGEDRYLELQLLLNHRMYRIVEPLAWYHTETLGVCISTLGVGVRPLLPILIDPEQVRMNCNQTFRVVLERYLASHALGYAKEYLSAGHLSIAGGLIRRFPMMAKFRGNFARLMIRFTFAKLISVFGIKSIRVSGEQ